MFSHVHWLAAVKCASAGSQVLNIWGGTAGNWGRRPLDLDEMEIMVLACKPPDLSN
jgi:hypothetical protein